MSSSAVQQYLARYAESESYELSWRGERFERVLVVPVRDEPVDFLKGYDQAVLGDPAATLIVVVLNNSVGSDELCRNQLLLERVRACPGRRLDGATPMELRCIDGKSVLLVDRSSSEHALPPKEGVGLARKIGSDLGLALHARGAVRSPWIYWTDADTCLPPEHLSARHLPSSGCYSGVLFEFQHIADGNENTAEATQLYELSLRYYTAGLTWAGSPYAYHSMGSAMAVHAGAYAQVRGVPKRQAGEDFYLLNKLVKVAPLFRARAEPVSIRCRLSSRVPFGTGPAVQKLIEGEAATFYHPEIFRALRAWHRAILRFATDPNSRVWDEPLDSLGSSAQVSRAVLASLGCWEALPSAVASTRSKAARLRRILTWFDAFRTLQFVHRLREQGYRSLPWSAALAGCEFLDQQPGLQSTEGWLRHFRSYNSGPMEWLGPTVARRHWPRSICPHEGR